MRRPVKTSHCLLQSILQLHSHTTAALYHPKLGGYFARRSVAAQDHLMIFLSTARWVHVQEKKTACRTACTPDQDLSHILLASRSRSRTLEGLISFLCAALSNTLDGRWSVPLSPAWGRTVLLPTYPTQRSKKSQPCCLPSRRKETFQQRYSFTL